MRWLAVPAGAVLLFGCGADGSAGRAEFGWGGPGREAGRFVKPRGIVVDRKNKWIYVVDMSGRLQKFTLDGRLEASASLPDFKLGTSEGLAVTAAGGLLVADTHYHRVLRYSPDLDLLGSFGKQGGGRGQFKFPIAVAVDAAGDIYVAEYGGGNRVQKFNSRGEHLLQWGSLGSKPGELFRPSGLAVEADGNVLVADACNHRIQRFSPDGKFLAAWGRKGTGPGELHYPYDVAVLPDGSIAVAENYNNRLQRFSPEGKPLGIFGGPGRKPGQFARPWCLAAAGGGRLYVTDTLNHRVQVVRLDGVKDRPEPAAAALAPPVLGFN